MQIREWKPLAKGLATMVPGVYRIASRGRGGATTSAAYCYNVWAKHLCLLQSSGMRSVPKTVAELGPGYSLGVGICALLSGASTYYALDVDPYCNVAENLRLLNELVVLFQSRAAVDEATGWPDFSAHLDGGGFPQALPSALLAQTLSPTRVEAIRQALQGDCGTITVRYAAPWTDESHIARNSVDLILSQAVLEHVSDLETTLRCFGTWLKSDGWMSHQVDFTSHGITRAWNGHWQYPKWAWRIVVGGRPYLINRVPADEVVKLLGECGFRIVMDLYRRRPGGLPTSNLDREWQNKAVDIETLYVQARPTDA